MKNLDTLISPKSQKEHAETRFIKLTIHNRQKSLVKVFFIFLGFLVFSAFEAHAFHFRFDMMKATRLSGTAITVVNDDQAAVLQKCVDLAELQPFYPKNADGSFKQLMILQHGVSFPTNIAVSHLGKPLEFLSKEQTKGGNIEGYFYFHEFQVSQNSARIEYTYNYDQLSELPKMQIISLELQKASNGWIIINSKMEVR